MPSIYDGRACAHPRCRNKFRDVKEGNNYATLNDWQGSNTRPRMSTCPQSGEPLPSTLNLRDTCSDTPVAWQTVDGKLSTILGSELYEEQMRIHRPSGHTETSVEEETKKQNSFFTSTDSTSPAEKAAPRTGSVRGP